MTVSYWRRAGSLGEIRADVCVVGAGITGLSAALELERRGVSVVVVERHAVGHGASSRNAGFLMRGAAENYAEAIRLHGRERAREVWSLTEENLSLLRREGVEALASYRRAPSCLAAFDESDAAQLRSSATLLREDGFEASWVESGSDTMWTRASPLGGLLNPNDAACNPVELVRLIRGKVTSPVLEHQEVTSITEGAGEVIVGLADGRVRASRVLVCTNAYTSTILDGAPVAARRGQMLAARAEGVRLDCSYYVNRGSEYIRQAADGAIIVGGCRTMYADVEVGLEDCATARVQGAIEAFAARVIGPEFEVIARWSGPMGFSPDGLPLVGPVGEGVWLCAGFTGHGMSMAFVTARHAVRAMLGAGETTFPLSRLSHRSEA